MSSSADSRPSRPPLSWFSVGQLALGLLGTLFFWSQAVGALTFGFLPSLRNLLPGVARATLFALALSGALVGAIFLLSAVYALRRLTGREASLPWHPAWLGVQRRVFWLGPLAFALALAVGLAVEGRPPWNWVLFPLAHVTAALVPVWWWISLGSRSLRLRLTPQRRWGLVSLGLGVGPFASILAEIGLLVAGIILAAVVLGAHPQLAGRLEALGRRLAFSAGNPRAAQRVLRSAFAEFPWLVFLLLAFLGAVVPLLEEFFKPLGVWVLMGRRISPAEGFLAGMLSGGMFSLLEGLFSTAAGMQWGITMLGRAGTSLMHIAASGLVGYALVAAWEKRRYPHLAAAYLLAVALHGIWNVSVVVLSLGDVLGTAGWMRWLGAGGVGLVVGVCLLVITVLSRSGGDAAVDVAEASEEVPLPIEEGNEPHGLVDNPD